MGWRNNLFVLLAARHANDTLRQRHDREGQSTELKVIPSSPETSVLGNEN